jgi:flagellar basal body rod protein FlgB
MLVRAISNALSGIRSASRRQEVSAHNVANLLTDDFQPQRTLQREAREGGSTAEVQRSATPESVDVAEEFVQQSLAALQTRASLRVLGTSLELVDEILDATDPRRRSRP